RFSNNAWLQELPDPITKLTWDNAALMNLKTAEEFQLKNGDIVELNSEMDIPVWIVPGFADNTVTVSLGYGRTSSGKIGNNVGFNIFQLRPSSYQNFEAGLRITKTGRKHKFACTQDHWSLEDRPHIRSASLGEYRNHPDFANEMVEHPPLKSLWEEHKYDKGYQWGMAIDLTSCTGCNACVIACQSENNIPVVGKEQVANGREMHWLRIDRYFAAENDLDDPEVLYQPMACHHCEMAPCEQVCPVAATVHNKEGLNTMVYNRCIGTRYCSNNCPFKVRRFNFFNYTKDTPETKKMANNPDVTVRSRGVMEKCTYCVQRIAAAKHNSRIEKRDISEGEVQTACQQACPANAITFGNLRDPDSQVSKLKELNRNYTVLAELNLKSRTTYLARIKNPNPEFEG
ncbi:4Fe-4S dicluster domain-containing protein, partial [candidate division KSB1 bacterium]